MTNISTYQFYLIGVKILQSLLLCLLNSNIYAIQYINRNDSVKYIDSAYTFIIIKGLEDTTICLTYSITGICSSDLRYFKNQKIEKVIPINIDCPPINTGDEILINITKPVGYNLINPNEIEYNNPDTRNIILKIQDRKSQELIITTINNLHVFYFELSDEINKIDMAKTLSTILDSINLIKEDYFLFASNDRNPLIYESKEYHDDPKSIINYLNQIVSLNPSPAYLNDDIILINNHVSEIQANKSFQYTNLHIIQSGSRVEYLNKIAKELSEILNPEVFGSVFIYFDTNEGIRRISQRTENKFINKELKYIPF